MSSDDISEGSGSQSSSTIDSLAVSLSPPGLDECIFQSTLYFAFLRYLASIKANENLVFVKRATVFSFVNLPLRAKYQAASKIIWDFFSDSCSAPVNVSAETRSKLLNVIFRKDGMTLVNDELFDQAISEIRLVLQPLFANWIATNEWQKVPFFNAQPPSISVIIHLPSLRASFEAFLKKLRDDPKTSKLATLDSKMFQACVELQEVVDQFKADGISKKDAETIARRFIRAHKIELLSLPPISFLEMPNLHSKKKHSETGGDDAIPSGEEFDLQGQHTCMDFILDALDTLSQEITEHETFEHFIEEKNWRYVDVLKASLQQSKDKDGYAEIPTLAGILHSPTYGPLIADTLKGTPKSDQMHFLLEAQAFYNRFTPKSGHKLHSQERKTMHLEARKIFDTYLAKNSIEVPKRLKNDVFSVIHSFKSSKMNSLLFQATGAWVYNVISRSWIREVNSMLLWADHDFDNHSPAAKEMESLFEFSHIPISVADEQMLIPHPDDVIGNPKLFESFRLFVPANELTKACFDFIRFSKSILTSSPETQAEECEKLVALLNTIAKETPSLVPFKEEVERHMKQDMSIFNPAAFMMPCFLVTKMLLFQFYQQWISKCKSAYKGNTWVPVRSLTFVSNDAVPGTSWIPSVRLANNEVSSKSIPSKKRSGILSKIRGGAGSSPKEQTLSSPSGSATAHKSSASSSQSVVGLKLELGPPRAESLSPKKQSDDAEPLLASSESHKTPIRLPNYVQKSLPVFYMEIPSINETLVSSHLRRLFYGTFLEPRLGDEEKTLWNTLCKFQESFVGMSDPEIAEHQKDIREAAKKILDENTYLPQRDTLLLDLEKSKYPVSSKFFFNSEIELYGRFHQNYQSYLLNNHWVQH